MDDSNKLTRLSGVIYDVEVIEFHPRPGEESVVFERYLFMCRNGLRISVVLGPVSMLQWELAVLDTEGLLVGIPEIVDDGEVVRFSSHEEVVAAINKIAAYRCNKVEESIDSGCN